MVYRSAVFVVAQDFVLQCLLQRRGIQVALTACIGLAEMSGGFQRRKQPPCIARCACFASARSAYQRLRVHWWCSADSSAATLGLQAHQVLGEAPRRHALPERAGRALVAGLAPAQLVD